ncbi:hypothetical protein E2I00_015379 [Balaenoptera physalus]|uniref:Uncharacterized protein n=1 Tax=Balaenoptera physalus TaxID=9770 RepID=A0A643CA68_BALPH|nr:hypothetical protein E2I00_015379 [Balaenoptera physalus]
MVSRLSSRGNWGGPLGREEVVPFHSLAIINWSLEMTKIIVDKKSRQVSLEDTNTKTGDVIYLYRKTELEYSVAYLYKSLQENQGITQKSFEGDKENVFYVIELKIPQFRTRARACLQFQIRGSCCMTLPVAITSHRDFCWVHNCPGNAVQFHAMKSIIEQTVVKN